MGAMQYGTFNRSIRFLLGAKRPATSGEAADLLITNAHVMPMDQSDSRAQALAIRGERVLGVGSSAEMEPLVGDATEILDLAGRTVLPGFINAHDHTAMGTGEKMFTVQYSRSIGELQARLAEYAHRVPKGELILCDKVDPVGPRFGSLHLKEQRWPTRWELDAVAPDHYVALGLNHGAIVNTKLLDLVVAEGPEDLGGIVKDPTTGEPTGILTEAQPPLVGAVAVLRGILARELQAPVTEEMRRQRDIAFAEEAASVGFTTTHIAGADEFQTRFLLSEPLATRFVVYYDILDFFSRRFPDISEGNLARNIALIEELSEQYGARIGGKMLNDGDIVPPDNTAAVLEPYLGQPSNSGFLYVSGDELKRVVSAIHEADIQLAIHCCGDRCTEEVLAAYEYALQKSPRADHRHRIEHAELLTGDQIERMARLGVAAVMSPIFLIYDEYRYFLGEERVNRLHRNRTMLEDGVLLACGSDWADVLSTDPFLGMHVLVNHQNPEQRISVRDALRLYTINGAKVAFEEAQKGSLEPGKLADLVVLSDDPYTVGPTKIRNLQVVLTMVGGRIVYIDDRLFRNYP
jgi:predicted amidohydrolase YtcJ